MQKSYHSDTPSDVMYFICNEWEKITKLWAMPYGPLTIDSPGTHSSPVGSLDLAPMD